MLRTGAADAQHHLEVEGLLKQPQASAEAHRRAVRKRGVDIPIGLTTQRAIHTSLVTGCGVIPPSHRQQRQSSVSGPAQLTDLAAARAGPGAQVHRRGLLSVAVWPGFIRHVGGTCVTAARVLDHRPEG